MLCNHHLYLVPKHFHHPKGNPLPTKESLPNPCPLLSAPGNHPAAFCLSEFTSPGHLYQWSHTLCDWTSGVFTCPIPHFPFPHPSPQSMWLPNPACRGGHMTQALQINHPDWFRDGPVTQPQPMGATTGLFQLFQEQASFSASLQNGRLESQAATFAATQGAPKGE